MPPPLQTSTRNAVAQPREGTYRTVQRYLKSPGLYLDPAAKEGTIPSNKVLHAARETYHSTTEVLFCSNGINGRGTKVIRVTCGCKDGECDWNGLKLVMKISRPVKGRVPEHETIQCCIDMAVDEYAWVLKHLPIVLGWFIADASVVQDRLKIKFGDGYEERIICGSIQEELCPIMDLKSPVEFAQAMYDVLRCHERIYTHSRVLHRDVSQANIMFRRDGKKIFGVLNDYDLATYLGQ
ncbi:hypothetical protein BT96DRAFT_949523 [Gymnopus androsaceus JB14]|uniref:Fungal-type protein kinase domain-containing protein n=1 Tax=Gymnopus androsaceus JB14 TaxID=1447944 RepID=A0A6A4GKS7_9AGAR|nr:hypothetical protein BT96DRAFT_949523 [Gymnopus androsaceus JB14]